MIDLNNRTNIMVASVTDKPFVLYEDHRTLVYVLWHAQNVAQQKLSSPPLLVTFDFHDDAKRPSVETLQKIARLRESNPAPREVLQMVEWDLSGLDDDWLIAGMELGVIGDVINIGAEVCPNLPRFETQVIDGSGQTHRIWRLEHIWDALRYQGTLSDRHQKEEFSSLWQALGWAPGIGFIDFDGLPPIVLDFDLDCFSGELAGRPMAWPEELLDGRFRRKASDENWTAISFLDGLEERVAFRTVARESPFCGGTLESQRVLMALDSILWGRQLFSMS